MLSLTVNSIPHLTPVMFWMTCFYSRMHLDKNGLIILMTAGPSLWPCNFHEVRSLSKCANLVKAWAVHTGVFDMKMIASLFLLSSFRKRKQRVPAIFLREEISRKYLMIQMENLLTTQSFLIFQFTTGAKSLENPGQRTD